MSNFSVIFEHELRQTAKSKAFKTVTVYFAIMLLLLIGATFFMTIGSDIDATGSNVEGRNFAIADMTNDQTGERLCKALGVEKIENADTADFESLISNGDMECIVTVSNAGENAYHVEIYKRAALYDESNISVDISQALHEIMAENNLTALGLDEQTAQDALRGGMITFNEHFIGKFAFSTYVLSYLLIILMFLCITLYGQLVATNVATEKSSRTMEILITSSSPKSLLLGKVLGTFTAAMAQLLAFIAGAGIICFAAAGFSPSVKAVIASMFTIKPFDAVCIILFFALGFLLVAFVYGALGSLVSQIEDLSAVINTPTIFFVIGYMVAIIMSSSGEVSTLGKVCSFVPFWSPMVMTVRMAMENVPALEVVISLALQALACVVFALLGIKLYRMGTLMYGKAPAPKEIIKLLKSK